MVVRMTVRLGVPIARHISLSHFGIQKSSKTSSTPIGGKTGEEPKTGTIDLGWKLAHMGAR